MSRVLAKTALAILFVALLSASAFGQAGTCAGMTVGQLTSLNGYVPFPANNAWNTDISTALVDANSANYINYIGSTVTLHMDFLSGTYQGSYVGIPYQVVAGTQPKVNVNVTTYPDESDVTPAPIPSGALIEGYPKVPRNGDRHLIVLDKDNCFLYEFYHAAVSKSGAWSADGETLWDMTINEQRPFTWTSADAAGLAIFPGLARYDEVAAGAINHALRFTVPSSQRAFVLPATHWASTVTNTSAPPMGLRLRLKSSFNISGFAAEEQILLTAMKKYGLILADNGSAIFISGAPDPRWNNTGLHSLNQVTAADFEVVQTGTIYTPANVPTGPNPVISSFTANPMTVSAGQPVTLSWTTSGQQYIYITPQIGALRGTSVVVNPTATTTYTLTTTNQYGRSTASVTVTVQ